jgi:hypothetical protein
MPQAVDWLRGEIRRPLHERGRGKLVTGEEPRLVKCA